MTATLHDRIINIVGDRTYRNLGDLTQTNCETVRRYMAGCSPSAEFLSGLCQSLGVSGHWLLTGRGPMRESDMVQEALRHAKAGDLMGAMATTLQQLVERVESLEQYVQQIDTRVRVRATPLTSAPHATGTPDEPQSTPPGRPQGCVGAAGSALETSQRIDVVRRTVSQRSRSASG